MVEEKLAGERCQVIGSSMGGYLAALYADGCITGFLRMPPTFQPFPISARPR
jgi:predicted esterase YcpF (UPF0227 family)